MERCALVTLAAVVGLLASEALAWRTGVWIFKPLASTGFLAAAIAAGALAHGYGRIVFVALCLCWLGDVLLIPQSERIFVIGIASFLAGHLALIDAFVHRGVSPAWAGAGLIILAVLSFWVFRWLKPHLPRRMRAAVTAYVTVISLMVAAAIGTYAASPALALLAGAVAFALSDLSVARDRFVEPAFVNRAWGLPLYYAATLLLAASAAP
jgi:uncharacterized membrane protein YhhN